jgi:hypothetical protein
LWGNFYQKMPEVGVLEVDCEGYFILTETAHPGLRLSMSI